MTDEQPRTDAGPDYDEAPEKVLCSNCMTMNEPDAHFCQQCAMPLTFYATNSPLGQVYTAGYAYRRCTDPGVSLIMALGMWLIFGPNALISSMLFCWSVVRTFTWAFNPFSGAQAMQTTILGMPDASAAVGGPLGLLPHFAALAGLAIAATAAITAFYWTILVKTTRSYLKTRQARA